MSLLCVLSRTIKYGIICTNVCLYKIVLNICLVSVWIFADLPWSLNGDVSHFCVCWWGSLLSIALLAVDCDGLSLGSMCHILCWLSHLWPCIFPLYFNYVYLLIFVYFGNLFHMFLACCLSAVCCLLIHYSWSNLLWIWGGYHMSHGSCYNMSSLHHSSLLKFPVMVFWCMPNYCGVHPMNSVFAMYH